MCLENISAIDEEFVGTDLDDISQAADEDMELFADIMRAQIIWHKVATGHRDFTQEERDFIASV
ncbi:MAG: hypothetical protein LBU07_04725 [Coriobacteriales bacterium]|nr:hypothetical protein [Coriobacteriales bacterium]